MLGSCGEKGTLLLGWRKNKLVQPPQKTIWRFLRTKNRINKDPAIPLLGTHLDKTLIQKDTRTPMFIASLFTIAKTWEQLKYPSRDEWIKEMWYLCTTDYYSALERMK